jgi:hypothetical protein
MGRTFHSRLVKGEVKDGVASGGILRKRAHDAQSRVNCHHHPTHKKEAAQGTGFIVPGLTSVNGVQPSSGVQALVV